MRWVTETFADPRRRTCGSSHRGWKSITGPASPAKDKQLLPAAILDVGITLGLTKRAECCIGVTYAQPDRHQAPYIRDETYSAALAELVNTQHAPLLRGAVGRRHHLIF